MKTCKRSLVEGSVAILRNVRRELHNESDRDLVASVDEAIGLLDASLREAPNAKEHAEKALKILGRGLAALPWIQRLIDRMND